jgi:hypothetical protein
MRTTLNLDEDVLTYARSLAARLGMPFRLVINEALQAGLKSTEPPIIAKPYRTHPHKMGLRAGCNLDNIHDLLAKVEGDDRR